MNMTTFELATLGAFDKPEYTHMHKLQIGNIGMFSVDHIERMIHSPVQNYIVPGLTSWLLGEPSERGKVRVFTCAREHHEHIVPHSHRYDFECMVVRGYVKNYIWCLDDMGDDFAVTTIRYKDEIGSFDRCHTEIAKYSARSNSYHQNEVYRMNHKQIHSIEFSRDAIVLFLEGPELTKESVMLEPYVGGKKIPTGTIEDWMYLRE